jgi:hypothetical protein
MPIADPQETAEAGYRIRYLASEFVDHDVLDLAEALSGTTVYAGSLDLIGGDQPPGGIIRILDAGQGDVSQLGVPTTRKVGQGCRGTARQPGRYSMA